jgi:hypothetical protein
VRRSVPHFLLVYGTIRKKGNGGDKVGLFKKKKEKLKVDVAVGSTMNSIIKHIDIENDWVKQQIQDIGFIYDESQKMYVNLEINLAVLSCECIALNNLFKEHEADYLYKLTIEILGEVGVAEYALATVQEDYLPNIRRAISRNENQLEIVSLILYRKISQYLQLDEEKEGYDFMISTTIQGIIGRFLGKWKSTLELYDIQFS